MPATYRTQPIPLRERAGMKNSGITIEGTLLQAKSLTDALPYLGIQLQMDLGCSISVLRLVQ